MVAAIQIRMSTVDIAVLSSFIYQRHTMTPSHPHLRRYQPAPASSANQPLPNGACSAAAHGFNEASLNALSGDLRVAAAPSTCGWDRSRSRRSQCRCLDDNAAYAAVREGERHQIAQQIHDDLGGVLTGLRACIAVVIERGSRAGVAPDPLLVDASALADLAFQTVRRIAVNLRPLILEQMNIWTALECQVAQLARRTQIHLDYAIDPAVTSIDLGEARGIVIFRVICEALTNIEKHSEASRVSVRLFEAGGSLTVTVKDNGIGVHQGSHLRGMTLGISGMKEQARRFGGELVLTTDCDVGTMVQLTMPLGPDDDI